MSDKAFPRDKHLTAIAVAYANPQTSLIADKVLPRVPVFKKAFEYYEYPIGQGFTVPNLNVGEKSALPRVEIGGIRKESSTKDRGVVLLLTQDDIDQAPSNIDPREKATEQATNLVLLQREIDTAALVFNPAAYAAGNQADLSASSGANQWSNANADPLKYIRTQLDKCIIRPNVLALGQEVWSQLCTHSKVVKAANGNDGGDGAAARARIAEILELSEIVVGASFVNSVKPGKAPSMVRTWGKHALAFYRDATVSAQTGGMTFGFTAEYGGRVAGSKQVEMGLRGGVEVMAGESVRELIVAPDAAFFFQNAVA